MCIIQNFGNWTAKCNAFKWKTMGVAMTQQTHTHTHTALMEVNCFSYHKNEKSLLNSIVVVDW